MPSRLPVLPAPRRTVRVVFSLVALVLAPFSWWWSIDDPALRASGLTAWMMLASALFLSLSAAWRDRRPWVVGVAVLELCLLGLALWAFFVGARLPGSEPPQRAPDFTLPDQEGRPVTLARELERGPVLLVFYRGHW
jgi:thiol:disulfide interchange protein